VCSTEEHFVFVITHSNGAKDVFFLENFPFFVKRIKYFAGFFLVDISLSQIDQEINGIRRYLRRFFD